MGTVSSLKRQLVALVPGGLRRAFRRLRPHVAGRRLPVEHDIAAAVPFADRAIGARPDGPIAIICHLYHADAAAQIRAVAEHIPEPVAVFASTDTDAKRRLIEAAFAGWRHGSIEVRIAPNRGRDVAPRLITFADVYGEFPLVLFLHGKQSVASTIGAEWRDSLIASLAGSDATVRSVLALFARDPRLGIVMAEHIAPIRAMIGWYANYDVARRLAARLGVRIRPDDFVEFPAGSMFWARAAALRPLLDLSLRFDDFPPEAGQLENTTQHAVERLMLHAAERAGYRWAKVADPATVDAPGRLRTIADPAALDAFLEESRFALLTAEG